MKRLAAILLILTLLTGTLCLSACEQLKEALMHLDDSDDNMSDHAESEPISTPESILEQSGESSADDPVPLFKSGKIENIDWTLDVEGKLVFYGQGEMPHVDYTEWYETISHLPTGDWVANLFKDFESVKGFITTIVISEGITSLPYFQVPGAADGPIYIEIGTFSYFPNLKHAVLPSTLAKISSAFESCESLESIVIPNGISSIRAHAFSWCKSLKSVDIPDSVTQIGYEVFDGCISLESVSIGKGLSKIESGYDDGWYNGQRQSVFRGCTSLKSIDISPENTTYCFEGNCLINKETNCVVAGFKGAQIPSYVKRIGASAFEDSNITSIHIPDGVSYIGEYAFSNCTALKDIVIPDSTTGVGDFAFDGCTSLESAKLGNNVKGLGEGVFRNCSSLKSVVLPTGIPSICGYEIKNPLTSLSSIPAFTGCSSLECIVIPDGVEYIGPYAFPGCTALKDITLPSSLQYVGPRAFDDTTFFADQKNWENGVLYSGTCLIKASENLSGDYEIKEGTVTVADMAFYNCASLKSVVIPESVVYKWYEFIDHGETLFNDSIDTITVKSPTYAKEMIEYRFATLPNTLIFGEGIEVTPYIQENYTYAGTKTEDGETLSVYNKKS